jgi:3-methylcrotonyl-CoA carboxylase beta subunit
MTPPLTSTISTTSPEFLERAAAMDALVHQLEADLAAAREGGGPKAQQRMKGKGKLLPRERWVPAKFASTDEIIELFTTSG